MINIKNGSFIENLPFLELLIIFKISELGRNSKIIKKKRS